jgi:Phage major capsid protein E
MPQNFNLSQNFEIDLITAEQLLIESGKDPMLALLPSKSIDSSIIKWDQPENGYGLLSERGRNGEPDVTKVSGFREYSMEPGYYGERTLIDENMQLLQREYGTPNEPISLDFLVNNAVMQLSSRLVQRIRFIVAQLLTQGKFFVLSRGNALKHADSIAGFNLLTPAVSWKTAATATPLDDLLMWQNILQTGTSSKFGTESQLLMSDQSVNDVFATSQIRDKFRLTYGSSIMGLDGDQGVNRLLNAFGLPKIVRYNEGYYPSEALAIARGFNNFTKFLPQGQIIWAGTRPEGIPIGSFFFTRNLVNEDPEMGPDWRLDNTDVKNGLTPNVYTTLFRSPKPPVNYELDVGFNGGPAVRYPSAVAGIAYS